MIIHKITWGCMQDYFFNIWCFGRCWSPWSYATIVSFKVSKTIHSRRSHCKVCKSRKFSLVVKFQKQIHNPMKKLHLRCLVGFWIWLWISIYEFKTGIYGQVFAHFMYCKCNWEEIPCFIYSDLCMLLLLFQNRRLYVFYRLSLDRINFWIFMHQPITIRNRRNHVLVFITMHIP